jgi:hypothetical protein
MNRRHFVKHLAGLSSFSFIENLRAQEENIKKNGKKLIVLWMGGGPSHMDLWDLKQGQANGGEFKQILTSANGVSISEVLPTIASQFHNLVAVRSLVTNEGSHERGTVLMNTGHQPSVVVQYPSIGSITSSLLTPKELPLPGFIGIGNSAQRIGSGFLGTNFAPFTVQNAGTPPENIKPPKDIDDEERLRRRQRLFYALEDDFSERIAPHIKSSVAREAMGNHAQSHSNIYGKAFDLTLSPLKTVFELKDENPKVIESYGGRGNNFGMGCLLARKLISKGVSCVQIDLGGWDNHSNIFSTIRGGNGNRLDMGMGYLVKDLVDMGMWKDTVVMWMGEFGRTPKINQNGGRDHWARCWSVVLGGGTIKGGQVYGSTTSDGMDIKDKPCSIADIYSTVYKALGLDPMFQIRDNLGRPIPISEGKPLDIF